MRCWGHVSKAVKHLAEEREMVFTPFGQDIKLYRRQKLPSFTKKQKTVSLNMLVDKGEWGEREREREGVCVCVHDRIEDR